MDGLKFVLFSMVFAGAAIAAGEKLQPVNPPSFPGETRCLPLFVLTTFGGAAAPQIIFAYGDTPATAKHDTIPKERAVVQLDGEAPTYTAIKRPDGLSGALFQMSKEEYSKYKACLPQPQAAAPQK